MTFKHRFYNWILIGLLYLPLGLFQSNPQQPAEQTHFFNEYGYGDRTASYMFSSLEYYFPVAQDIILDYGTSLNLVISHSNMLKPSRSTMTIVVNNVAHYSTRLDETNHDHKLLRIPLPVENFQDDNSRIGGYVVRLQFFMRLTDLVCEESSNPALWTTVFEESYIEYISRKRTSPIDLSYLPYPFLVQNSPDAQRLTFAFPPQPSIEVLQAAVNMSAYFGNYTGQSRLEVQARTDGDVSQDTPNITFGFDPSGAAVSGPGVISISEFGDQSLLSLSGDSPVIASLGIINPDSSSKLNGKSKVIGQRSNYTSEGKSWPWEQDAATFAQLGFSNRTVYGIGNQQIIQYFSRPAGWEMTTDKVFLDIKITFSPQLQKNHSGMNLKINGIDMGAISYEVEPSKEGFYRFELPAELLNVGYEGKYSTDLILEMEFKQYLQQSECEPIYSENAWSTIHADSYFFLPHSGFKLPDISHFPYPFLNPNELEPILFVIPKEPTLDEIDGVLWLAKKISQESFYPFPEIEIQFSDQIEKINGNAILIGTPERNKWIEEGENQLNVDQRGLVQTSITQDAIGNLKEYESPWKNGKWVLEVLSNNNIKTTILSLDDEVPSASILCVRGDGTNESAFHAVPPPQVPKAYHHTRAAIIPKPETWQIVLAVLVATVIVTVLTILIYRRRTGEE